MAKISTIPKDLRDTGLFCCWQHEIKNGRKTKIPYNPATGQRAQTNKPETFTDFKTALNAVKDYSGMGFLITNSLFVSSTVIIIKMQIGLHFRCNQPLHDHNRQRVPRRRYSRQKRGTQPFFG